MVQVLGGIAMQGFQAIEVGIAEGLALDPGLFKQAFAVSQAVGGAGALQPVGQGGLERRQRGQRRAAGAGEKPRRLGDVGKLLFQGLHRAVGRELQGGQVLQLLVEDQRGLDLENIAVGFVLLPGDAVDAEALLQVVGPGLAEGVQVRVGLDCAG